MDLVMRLNMLRYLYGYAVRVTSGARCHAYNKAVGGAPMSAHLPHPGTGQCRAADVLITDSAARHHLLALAHRVGFERVGIGDTFMHLDRAVDLPQPAMWVY